MNDGDAGIIRAEGGGDMLQKNVEINEVASVVAQKISDELGQGKRVLWFLSGGSGGQVCVDASKLLNGKDLSRLTVTMGDERYGKLGHKDENFKILAEGGLKLDGATLYRPLFDAPLTEVVNSFNEWLDQKVEASDYVISITGIGTDGHAFGVKPNSPAVTSNRFAEGFLGEDFARFTLTPKFVLSQVDEMIVQAYGKEKHVILDALLDNRGEIEGFPALMFNQMKNVTLFSDYKEEK